MTNSCVPAFEAIAKHAPFEFISLSDQGVTPTVMLEGGDKRALAVKFPDDLSYRKCDEGDALV